MLPGSFALLHFYFGRPQEGPVFLFFLPLCIRLEISPAVHATIPTFLGTRKYIERIVKKRNMPKGNKKPHLQWMFLICQPRTCRLFLLSRILETRGPHQPAQYLKDGGTKTRAGLFLVMPSARTRGTNWNTGGSI